MYVKYWLDNVQHQWTLHILYILTTLHYQTIQPYINSLLEQTVFNIATLSFDDNKVLKV